MAENRVTRGTALVGELGTVAGVGSTALKATITTEASSVNISGNGLKVVNNATGGGTTVYTLADPSEGQMMTLFVDTMSTSTGTDAVKVKHASTATTFQGQNKVATLDAAGEALQIVAASANKWYVTSNVGSVSFAATT